VPAAAGSTTRLRGVGWGAAKLKGLGVVWVLFAYTGRARFTAMSTTQILEELPRLSRLERRAVLDRLYELEETDLLLSPEPDDTEKALLDRELEAYTQTTNAGAPWPEVAARLRQ
jgi:hypothetical protein